MFASLKNLIVISSDEESIVKFRPYLNNNSHFLLPSLSYIIQLFFWHKVFVDWNYLPKVAFKSVLNDV